MSRCRLAVAISTIALGVSACGPEVVEVEVNFPSQETFLRSQGARLFRFRLRSDQRGVCPKLLMETSLGQPSISPEWDSGLVSVCDLHAGLTVPIEGAGWEAFIVLIENEDDRVLLTGCTVTIAAESGVAIRLSPTKDYVDLYVRAEAPPLTCKTAAEKCDAGCD
jgi:hypothetical protein